MEAHTIEMVCTLEGSEGRKADEVSAGSVVRFALSLADDCTA
jgi:hypothetical protein